MVQLLLQWLEIEGLKIIPFCIRLLLATCLNQFIISRIKTLRYGILANLAKTVTIASNKIYLD